MDERDQEREWAKVAAAAAHTAGQAEILEAAVEAAEGKVAKAEDRVKAAKSDLTEAKRTAKEARAEAKRWETKARDAGAATAVVAHGRSVTAGAADASGAVN